MIRESNFGTTPNGTTVKLYTLQNENGVVAKITNYGGILTSLRIPVKEKQQELVLGFDDLNEYTNPKYLSNNPYFGALIGRYANRINKGKVHWNGTDIQLSCNHGIHHLHGGISGFDQKIWKAEILEQSALKLTYTSPDGEENFPGELVVEVIYRLTNENELQVYYKATCDQSTPINLTQHSYFNLSEDSNTILDHYLQIDADYIVDTDELLIPSGKLTPVKHTCFDFRKRKTIQQDIAKTENYDDCFVVSSNSGQLRKIASLSNEQESIAMEIATTFPGLQVYTGKYIQAGTKKKFGAFSGIALEAQGFPDAPNHEEFKHGWLHPGEVYQQQTNYKFIF